MDHGLKVLTREAAITILTDRRVASYDEVDLRDWITNGRTGYAQLSNELLTEQYSLLHGLNEAGVTITGQEPSPVITVSVERNAQLTGFLRLIANMQTDEEFGEEGMSGDDAVMTLSQLIIMARRLEKGE